MDRVRRAGLLARTLLCLVVSSVTFGCYSYRDINLHADAQRPIGHASFPNLRMNVTPPQGQLLQSAESTVQELRSWIEDAQDGAHPVQLKFSSSVVRKRNPVTFTACVLTLGVLPASANTTVRSELVVEASGTRVHAHTVTERVREVVVVFGGMLGIGGGGDESSWANMQQHLFERSMAAHRNALFDTVHKHGQEYLSFVQGAGPEANLRFAQTHPNSLFRELAERRAQGAANSAPTEGM